jgi:septal ring factor EnvC (AmiA/AmiB activator)
VRRLAAWAALMLLVSSAAAQDDATEACGRGGSDLSGVLECLGRTGPARPYDDAAGKACASLASEKFLRPVQGRTVLRYGEATQFGSRSKGVVIETRAAAQVVAPVDSLVIYAGEFRSYGKLLVLDPGCGMRFLLAGVSETDVMHGQLVLAGEPVATMSRSPTGSAPGNMYAPVLYVELRRGPTPIDPGPDIAAP